MDTATAIENIRFSLGLIGDSATLISDTEIERYITLYPAEWRLAAAALADALAARAINAPTSFGVPGRLTVSWASRAQLWLNVAKQLRLAVQQDDAAAASTGVGVTQLRKIGIEVEDDEYARPRRDYRLT